MSGASKEVQEFQFKLNRKLRLFPENQKLDIENPVKLVSTASKYGLIFAGCPFGMLCINTNSILTNDPKRSQGPASNDFARREIPLEFQPTHIEVNADNEFVAVVVFIQDIPVLQVYSVPSFAAANIQKKLDIRLSTTGGVKVLDLQWNPGVPNMIGAVLSDGSAVVFECKDSSFGLNSIPPMAQATCLCWSPKGKQIVLGARNGSLTQYKPELKAVKTFSPPAANMFVVSVHWLSSFQFLAAYGNSANPTDRPAVMIVNVPKNQPTSFVTFEEVCFGFLNKRPEYFFIHQQTWNMVFMGSGDSMEVSVLGSEPDGVSWTYWKQDDSSRAEIPLTEAGSQDVHNVGVAIDYSSAQPVPINDSLTIGPMPLLLVMSHSGVLCVFRALNFLPGAAALCSPPQPLPDHSGVHLFIQPQPQQTQSQSQVQPQNQPTSQPQLQAQPSPQPPSQPQPQALLSPQPPSQPEHTLQPSPQPSLQPPPQPSLQPPPQPSLQPPLQTVVLTPSQPQSVAQPPSHPLLPTPSQASQIPPQPQMSQQTTISAPVMKSNLQFQPGFNAAASQAGQSSFNFMIPKPLAPTSTAALGTSAPATATQAQPSLFQSILSQPPAAKPALLPTPSVAPTTASPSQIPLTTVPFSTGPPSIGTQSAIITPVSQKSSPAEPKKLIQMPESKPPSQSITVSSAAPTPVPVPAVPKEPEPPRVDDSVYRGAIHKDLIAFQAKFNGVRKYIHSIDTKVDDENVKGNLLSQQDHYHEFAKELVEATAAEVNEVNQLRSNLLDLVAFFETIKTRHSLLSNPWLREMKEAEDLDPISKERLKSIEQQLYYIQSQLKQVAEFVDNTWKKQNGQTGIKIPKMEVVHQTIKTMTNIINVYKLKLNDIESKLNDRLKKIHQSKKTFSHFETSKKTPSEEPQLAILAQKLLQTKLSDDSGSIEVGACHRLIHLSQKGNKNKIAEWSKWVQSHKVVETQATQMGSSVTPLKSSFSRSPPAKTPSPTPKTPVTPKTESQVRSISRNLFDAPKVDVSILSTPLITSELDKLKSGGITSTPLPPKDHLAEPPAPSISITTLTTVPKSPLIPPALDSKASQPLGLEPEVKPALKQNLFSGGSGMFSVTPSQPVSTTTPVTSSFQNFLSKPTSFGGFGMFTTSSTKSTESVTIADSSKQLNKEKESVVAPAISETSVTSSDSSGTQSSSFSGFSKNSKNTFNFLSGLGSTTSSVSPLSTNTPVASFGSPATTSTTVSTTSTSIMSSKPSMTSGSSFSFGNLASSLNTQSNSAAVTPLSPISATTTTSSNLFSQSTFSPSSTSASTNIFGEGSSFGQKTSAENIFSSATIKFTSSSTPSSVFSSTSATTVVTTCAPAASFSFAISGASTPLFGQTGSVFSSTHSVIPNTSVQSPLSSSAQPPAVLTASVPSQTPSIATSPSVTAATASVTSVSSTSSAFSITTPAGSATITPLFGPLSSPNTSATSVSTTTTGGSIFGGQSLFTLPLATTASITTPSSASIVPATQVQTPTPAVTSTAASIVTTTTTVGIFGQQPTSITASSVALTSTTPAFGQAATTSASLFGFVTPSTTTTTPFGQSTVVTTTTSSPFGQTSVATTTNAGLFGQTSVATTTTQPLFGQQPEVSAPSSVFSSATTTSQTSPFVQTPAATTTTTSVFGQPASSPSFGSTSGFGSTPSFGAGGSVFGSPTPQTTSAFGYLSFANVSTAKPDFGTSSATTSSTGIFGTPTSTPSVFGTPTTTASLAFGASLFSQTSQQQTSPFGAAQSAQANPFFNPPAASSSTFGQQPSAGNFGSSGGSLFGAGGFSSPQGGNIFGSSFGGGQSVGQTGFGSPDFQQNKTGTAFGSAPVFGSSPSFGGAPTFGSSPAFGSPNKLFGSPASPPAVGFTAPSNESANVFENMANQNTMSFGNLAQTQQTNIFGSPQQPQPASFSGNSFTSWR